MKSVRVCAAACVMAVLTARSAQAQTYKVLHAFSGKDGADPTAGLVRDADGNLYGTSTGTVSNAGTIFKVDKLGKLTVLYTFTGGSDGGWPSAGVIQGPEGTLYGATIWGGNSACKFAGCGTVFKLKTRKLTVLYSFTGWPDGAYPNGVIRDAKGNLYGTTVNGGSGRNEYCSLNGVPYGCGTVFTVDTSGKETVLHSFTDNADGGYPEAGVIQDAKGNLYGTTAAGGGAGCYHGCGVVFKLSKTGKETVLYRFTGGRDGASPYAGVIRDDQGNLYGTTYGGGAHGQGTVFRLSNTGKETVLCSFCSKSNCADGAQPEAGVIQDAEGNLYGTTNGGGGFSNCNSLNGCGTVFKLDTKGEETVLHGFTGGADGAEPEAGVILDSLGNIYGTAVYGGNLNCGDSGWGCGVVFKLTP
jgi:uncharacterized repeat protein (TIGR03803 family)